MSMGLRDYAVDYFESIARLVFGEYMVAHGFKEDHSNEYGAIFYVKTNVFFHVGYYPESSPDYVLDTVTGFLQGGGRRSIGLWRALPQDSLLIRESEPWMFSNESELKQKLIFIRDHVVDSYVATLWENQSSLLNIVEAQERELRAQEQNERLLEKRTRAGRAFEDKDYLQAAKIYGA